MAIVSDKSSRRLEDVSASSFICQEIFHMIDLYATSAVRCYLKTITGYFIMRWSGRGDIVAQVSSGPTVLVALVKFSTACDFSAVNPATARSAYSVKQKRRMGL